MKTLIWKEWREQRLFFFLAVGIIILNRIAPVFFPKGMIHYDKYAGVLSHFVLPIIFSLFLGTITFVNEFTRNTKSFLLSQPFTAARIFWVKFLSALILLLILVLLAHFAFFGPFNLKVFYSINEKWLLGYPFLFFPIIIYSAACLSSLLLRNILQAIICTPFILLLIVFITMPLFVVSYLAFSSSNYLLSFIFSFCIIAVFVIYDFLIWQKALVKEAPSRKIIFAVTAVILVFSLGIYAIANIVVNREFNKTAQKAKTFGIPLTLQEIIPSPVLDKDNAALVYQQAFDLAEKLKTKYKKEWEYMPYASLIPLEKLTPAQKERIVRIISEPDFAEFYALVDKAVNLPACRFDIKYEKGLLISGDIQFHLSGMRNLARLVGVRTYILTEEKRYQETLKSTQVGLRLGDSLANEPILISQLVRIAIDGAAATKYSRPLFSAPLNAISSGEYQKLISEIDQKDKRLTIGIEGEPVLFDGYQIELVYLGGPQRTLRSKNFLKAYRNYVLRPMFKPESEFYMQGIMTLVGFSNQPYFSIKNALGAWEKKIAPNSNMVPKYILARMIMPVFSRTLQQQAVYTANLDSFKLALALKIYKQEHGYYPEKLASLSPEVIPELPLDPFIGKDYIYRKEGRGFILYSIGPNEKDDNGIYDQEQSDKYDDIAWKVLN